ncbi:hypothetical protein ACMUMQ_12735 [Marinomonas sp. 2405UD66-6]|uniref:hypothetical protein n=1 Tax=Marinomonas sp. 2405UD66-6 TaxID=3391834 RepID=UPI0039C9C96D
MPKWLIWTLLELTTFLMLANLTFLWLSHRLNKDIQKQEQEPVDSKDSEANNTASADLSDNTKVFKRLAHFLDQQISHAAAMLSPKQENQHETNTLKLWGTILRAERAIVLNQASEQPKPILNRFLANLLYAISTAKLQTADPEELQQNLKDMEDEFFQSSELLITKESLSKNQMLLNEDLRNNIDRANKRIKQMGIKIAEQQRLQIEIDELQRKIKALEATQKLHADDFPEIQAHLHETQNQKAHTKSATFKQISSLNNLSNRQQMVIEQLKIKIDQARKSQGSGDGIESQKIAIAKMERLAEESQTIILQLEAEMETSNLSITSLRQDINAKDEKLAELEKMLSRSNETAIGNLQNLHASRKETLGSLRDDLNIALESNSSENLIEQDKDTKMLERLLQESETCVTLLAQELETAEEENNQLKVKVNALAKTSSGETPQEHRELLEQREKNRTLVEQTTNLKNQLLNSKSSKDLQGLRVEYNKKSLECDRLQLAFADLEMKYLGTLN